MLCTVTEATEKDAPALAAAEKLCFPADAWSAEAVAAQLAAATGVSLCAWEDGALAGYLFGSYIPPEGEVLRVAVLPARRGKGVGQALLSRFLAGVPVCFLEVREGNLAARRLYEKTGFRLSGRRRAYYRDPREDACLYTRQTDACAQTDAPAGISAKGTDK